MRMYPGTRTSNRLLRNIGTEYEFKDTDRRNCQRNQTRHRTVLNLSWHRRMSVVGRLRVRENRGRGAVKTGRKKGVYCTLKIASAAIRGHKSTR